MRASGTLCHFAARARKILSSGLGCLATSEASSVTYATLTFAVLHYGHGSESVDDEQVVFGPVFVPDQWPVRRQPPLAVDLELDLVLALRTSMMLSSMRNPKAGHT